MNQPSPTPEADASVNSEATVDAATDAITEATVDVTPAPATKPKPSYVKLAMRNMVRKRGTSLYHFALTTIGLLTALITLAYLTR
ncbi:MAG TPA: DUF3285 domain-containing protein [Trichocoleus sp.]|jgi:hypothetical protein